MEEKEIIEIERKVHLLTMILVIAIIMNIILVAIIFYQSMDENIERDTSIMNEQHDAPITIYNNITIITVSENQTRSVESNSSFQVS